MKKDKVENILLRYSGVATLVLGSQAVQAQVVWNDIADDTLNTNGAYVDLDIDTNGVVDYRITQFVDSINNGTNITGVQIETFGSTGNQVLGLDYANYNYPFRLNVGDTIGVGRPFKGLGKASGTRYIGYMAVALDNNTYPNSQFVDRTNGVTDGFLGLKFYSLENDTVRAHYGWIRVDVAADLRSIIIKDFAYEETPDSMITAGKGSPIGLPEVKKEAPEVVQRGQFLDIQLPEGFRPEAHITIVDMSGRVLKQLEISALSSRVPLQGLPKGILIATVSSNGVDSSKKIVIY